MAGSTLLLVAAIAALAAVGHTVAGFGFSLLAVPLLGLVVDPKEAVAIASVLLLVNSALIAWGERTHIDWPSVGLLLRGAVLGLPFGLLVLAVTPVDVLRVGLGIAVLGAVALLVSGVEATSESRALEWAGGFACGVLTTSLNTNGPPVAAVLQARGLAAERFRPTISAVLGSASLAGAVLFFFTDRMGGEVGESLVVAVPGLVVGWGVGLLLRQRVPQEWFRRFVLALLIAAGIATLMAAWST